MGYETTTEAGETVVAVIKSQVDILCSVRAWVMTIHESWICLHGTVNLINSFHVYDTLQILHTIILTISVLLLIPTYFYSTDLIFFIPLPFLFFCGYRLYPHHKKVSQVTAARNKDLKMPDPQTLVEVKTEAKDKKVTGMEEQEHDNNTYQEFENKMTEDSTRLDMSNNVNEDIRDK